MNAVLIFLAIVTVKLVKSANKLFCHKVGHLLLWDAQCNFIDSGDYVLTCVAE